MKPIRDSEGDIKSNMRQFLEFEGYEVQYIMPQKNRIQSKGVPDMCAMRDGVTYWIEAKKPGGTQTASQKLFQQKCVRAGVPYILSDNLDNLMEIFNDLG
jgi:hypothetical protein